MFFDTNTFDFDSISDVIGFDNEQDAKAHSQKPTKEDLNEMGGVVDDISDILGNIDLNAFDTEEPEDENNNVSDLIQEAKQREVTRLNEAFKYSDDDQPFDLEGVSLTKKQLKELYNKKVSIEDDSAALRQFVENINSERERIERRSLMQQTQLESNIMLLRQRLQNPHILDSDYATYSRQLVQSENAFLALNNEVNQIRISQLNEDKQINFYRIRAADQQMINDYPEWNKYKGEILNYAKESGIPGTTLEKVYDAGMMKILMKAFMYDKNKEEFSKRIKSDTTAVNARSSTGAKSSTRTAQEEAATTQRKARALNKMGSSRQGNIDAFDFLAD